MNQPLDYASRAEQHPSAARQGFARVSLGYPPRPSQDDPRSIAVAHWLWWPTVLLVLSLTPAAAGALIANMLYVFDRVHCRRPIGRHLTIVAVTWGAGMLFYALDPFGVLY